jgi:hypothetical protein
MQSRKLMEFGKHEGAPIEYVVLRYGDYASWLINQQLSGPASEARKIILDELIPTFDAKPLVAKCCACGSTATTASTHLGEMWISFWCGACNPTTPACGTVLRSTFSTYLEVLQYATDAELSPAHRRSLIRKFAEAKGCLKRVTSEAALHFFYDVRVELVPIGMSPKGGNVMHADFGG